MKIKIESDVFDICKRIKEIDENYFVLFNLNSKKFEIHNSKYKNPYCLTIPYERLDSRTIELLCSTDVKNYDKIIKNLDVENERNERRAFEKAKEISDYKIREILKYSKSDNENLNCTFKSNWL